MEESYSKWYYTIRSYGIFFSVHFFFFLLFTFKPCTHSSIACNFHYRTYFRVNFYIQFRKITFTHTYILEKSFAIKRKKNLIIFLEHPLILFINVIKLFSWLFDMITYCLHVPTHEVWNITEHSGFWVY